MFKKGLKKKIQDIRVQDPSVLYFLETKFKMFQKESKRKKTRCKRE